MEVYCEETSQFQFKCLSVMVYPLLCLNSSIFKLYIYLEFFFPVPELQGEPEEISKEKARLAAKEVFFLIFYCSVYCLETKDGNA